MFDYEFVDDLNRVGFPRDFGTGQNLLGLYYRLKQIDYDGKYEYSNIVNITMKQSNNSTIKFFPNPATDILTWLSVKKAH